jgi:aryl-alcohol dehydrogenase-like predicted oxidoreductase
LEGAKYLQSLLHELDAEIANVISFSAYEEHVMNVVIPALFGTFEELDEPSTHILSNFFAAHGWTIRHALATRTRKMLQNSEHDIPSNVKLQEFALEFLFKENSIDKVIMGATQPEQILDAVGVWNKISS